MSRTSDILYNLILTADELEVSRSILTILDAIQNLKVHNQLLGAAGALVSLLELYDMNYSDVLGTAYSIMHSHVNEDADRNFKAVKHYMKNEWNLA